MRRKNFDEISCGIARAMGVLGDAWTFVIVREAMFGVTAFDEFVSRLEIPRNTLAARLEMLVARGIMSRTADESDARRSVYQLEESGRDLWIVMLALQQWGNKWLFEKDGAPSFMADRRTDKPVATIKVYSENGDELSIADMTMVPGPSAPASLQQRFEDMRIEKKS